MRRAFGRATVALVPVRAVGGYGRMTFEEWMSKVETVLEDNVGIGNLDLPDIDYWDRWNAGERPATAALAALRESGW